MNHTAPTSNGPTLKGWLTSLLFWIVVLVAVGMYALVALSPKVLAWQQERARWRVNQERLVRLERKVHYLQQVAQALESDPEFAAELARIELNATRPGDERLPVEGRLTLAAETKAESGKRKAEEKRRGTTISAFRLPPSTFEKLLREFAENAGRRRWTLFAAAALVVFAFVFLQESPARKSTDDGNWFARRYGRKRRV